MKIKFGRKSIGEIVDRTFKKKVERSKHLFWSIGKRGAWGIDAETFNHAVKPNCDIIEIYDKQTKTTYTTSVDFFDENARYLHFKPHGAQRFLDIELWKEIRK